MTTDPYASARTVFWIVDNGSSHAGRASIERLEGRWRNLRLIHLPIHASWLNQIELYFSIVQRKALTPNDFASLAELEQRLLTFGRHYHKIAEPFAWSFTRQDLDRVLRAIDTHQPRLALAARTSASLRRPAQARPACARSRHARRPPRAGSPTTADVSPRPDR
jgi:hypothetical protein